MTLEELAYLFQIIGVFAVFASIVYVAIQPHQNGRMMGAKAARNTRTFLGVPTISQTTN